MPLVNGHPAETGCYVDGHWGQYGPDHLADQAEAFGWTPDKPTDDPRAIRAFADEINEAGYGAVADAIWEWHTESANDIETWLNERTPDVCTLCGVALTWEEGLYRSTGPDGRMYCDDAAKSMHRPQSYVWHWHGGEFFLSPICDDPDNCEDETCAHWD